MLCVPGDIIKAEQFFNSKWNSIKVNEGKVGIYLKYGALMDDTTGPGMHTMAPFVTEVRENQWF